jgi:hypothetical protein
MALVTYKGPRNPKDPTTRLRVPAADFGGDQDVVLRRGVETRVPEAAVRVLQDYDGHDVEVASGAAVAQPTSVEVATGSGDESPPASSSSSSSSSRRSGGSR